MSTLAGNAGMPGNLDGSGTNAKFHTPIAVVANSAGYAFVADMNNHVIRKISLNGMDVSIEMILNLLVFV